MSKDKKMTPELRFPEFAKEEAWKKKRFEELFDIGNGRDYKHLDKGDIPVYGSGGYMLSVNDYLYDGESACIGRKGTIDKPMFLDGKFWTVDTLFYTHSFKNCSPKYIYYVFQNIDWLKHNEAGGVPSLSKTNIYKIETLVPKLKEQQKIAFCLSSLDELIAAHSQKLELLKEHKKGLMQNLFPQEGEKVPKYRFKEFIKDGEWIEKTIGDFIESHKGGASLSPSDFVTKSAYEVIPKKAIGEGMWLKIETPTYCSEAFYNLNEQSVIDNTYLITTLRDLVPSGPNIGYIVKYKTEKKYILAQGVYGLKIKDDLLPDFLIHFSNSKRYRTLVNAIMVGSTQVHIRNGEFFNVSINVPTNIKEQEKIASCLSSLDALITAQVEKIEQFKLHKKGLMQGLFPKNND